MLMRHFGHGVGHLKYEGQQEAYTKRVTEGDANHSDDDTSKTEDNADSEAQAASESEPEGDPGPVVNDLKDISASGDSESEEIDSEISDTGSDYSSEGDGDGYASL